MDVRSAFGVLAVSVSMALASRVEYESSKVEKRNLNGKQFQLLLRHDQTSPKCSYKVILGRFYTFCPSLSGNTFSLVLKIKSLQRMCNHSMKIDKRFNFRCRQ